MIEMPLFFIHSRTGRKQQEEAKAEQEAAKRRKEKLDAKERCVSLHVEWERRKGVRGGGICVY